MEVSGRVIYNGSLVLEDVSATSSVIFKFLPVRSDHLHRMPTAVSYTCPHLWVHSSSWAFSELPGLTSLSLRIISVPLPAVYPVSPFLLSILTEMLLLQECFLKKFKQFLITCNQLYKINLAPQNYPGFSSCSLLIPFTYSYFYYLSQNNLKIFVLYLVKAEFNNYMIFDVCFLRKIT